MKLSKQERIAVLVIAVIILLVLGVIFFIVPKFEEIGTDSATLVNKQVELANAVERANTKDQLRQDVIAAYDEGRNIADMFFEEMQPYEADNEVRNFLQYCKDKDINMQVEALTIGEPTVASLGVNFYSEPEVEYDLKTYVTQGRDIPEEELAAQERDAILQSALATTQTVGSIDVSFTVSTLSIDEMMKFVDTINDYVKEENSNDVRKAIRLSSGLGITYTDIEEEYEELSDELVANALKDAIVQIQKETGLKVENSDDQNENAEGENKDEEFAKFERYVYKLEVTMTMYSIERMQDPTDQLTAQDAQ